ncbi:hypothetical protein FC19_GL000357 [Liquorilactobacillus aquaticus DSM 21051]|uniref:Flagellar protein FliT n=2 Tax=Liquorilactobacillus aquaticus TaxID=392566 RepID=A0A0R2CYT2_9LACO|nr:hypothetical protein [Liquorilactobacillus aquaticus]AJA33732.1 hypothetical protein [Liquorilactobacillus aquaticus]KRM96832.1 hypothetical protein FC19_GL000357 [Liquorilactobacillus aquaticus DSM 21051]
MNKNKELLEKLQQLNSLLGSWDGQDLDQAERILKDSRAMITVLDSVSLKQLTSSEKEVIDRIVAQYGKLVHVLSVKKGQLAKKIAQLNKPNSTIRTYLQQEQGASLIDVDF